MTFYILFTLMALRSPDLGFQDVYSRLNFTLELKECGTKTQPQEIPASTTSSHLCASDLEISFIQFFYIWYLFLMSYPYAKPFKTRSLCLVWATAPTSGALYPTFLGPPASLHLCHLFITNSQLPHLPIHPHFLLRPVARLGQTVCLGTTLYSLHSGCPSSASPLLTKPGIW